jgi:hypothetical protein
MATPVAPFEVLGEQLLLPIDRARALLNRLVLSSTLGRGMRHKETRIAVRALVGLAVTLSLTAMAPLLLFAIGPVLFGVPHLAADLRYLVLQPRYTPTARALVLLGCVPFVLVRGLPIVGVVATCGARVEVAAATVCLLAAAIAAGLSARAPSRLLVVVPLLMALGALAYRHTDGARIVFVHLHNLVAIVLWGLLFRARRGAGRALALPVACTTVATLAMCGWGAVHAESLAATEALGVRLGTIAGWLAPGLPLRAGIPIVLSYILLQSVHYSIWLGLVPAEAVRGDAARSFRMSLRALLRDFGAAGLVAIALFSIGTVALATRNLNATRDTYLTLSAFHGYLELAVLVIAACGRRDLFAVPLGARRRTC